MCYNHNNQNFILIRKRKNKMKNHYVVTARILAFLLLIVGTISIFSCLNRVVLTAVNLIVLNDNIRCYNEAYRKTDEMTEQVEEYFAERAKYYNSEDKIVNFYANLPTLLKALVLLGALAMYLAVPAMWVILLLHRICKSRRRAAANRKR